MADLSDELGFTKPAKQKTRGEQLAAELYGDAPPEKGFGEKLSDNINDIPRQAGLTGRYLMEGLGGTLNTLATPFRAAQNAIMPASMQVGTNQFSRLADKAGLPQPKNSTERIVGDVSRVMAGSAIPMALAGQTANVTTGTTQAVAKMMAANPTSQIVSAAGSGAAGGYTRETGGDSTAQFIASMAGGIGAPMAFAGGKNALSSLASLGTAKPQIQLGQIDIKIENALKGSNIDFGKLPENIRNSIRQDVGAAMQTGGNLSEDAVRRLADYKLTGLTPTQGTLTLDPAIVTQQKNLAKLGINNKDKVAQQLGALENQNNTGMIGNLNTLGASRGVESEIAGGALSGHLADYAAKNKASIGELYGAARDSSGRSASLDPSHFTQKLGDNLAQANLEAFLPAEIRGMVNNFATGKTPFNVNTAEQFKTIVGNAQRSSLDGNVKHALGLVRNSIDDTPLLNQNFGGNQVVPGGSQINNVGQEAIDAFTKARSANRQFMGTVEKTPALEAAMDGMSDKGFFQKFVIGGDAKSLKQTLNVLSDNPAAIQTVRDQVLGHLKEKALNGAVDEVGKFSQSKYNSALKMLGSSKLEMLFNADEIAQLRALGRVASYEQFQPVGAAVNNSNTSGALGGMLERIGNSPLLSKIPMGKMLAEPIQNISIGLNSKNALNVPNALSTPRINPYQNQQNPLMISPAIFGGLLGQYGQ